MAVIHRNSDLRTCGASTIASQSKVTVGGQAVARVGDVESHGGGAFNENGRKVSIDGIHVVCIGDSAVTDSLLHPDPAAATGFAKLTIS
jgi:uncharacterized Zn-binding protein involved in type VI secretion